MNRTIAALAAGGLLAFGLLVSCTLSGMTESGFATELMRAIADSTGAYTPAGKAVVYDQDGLKIDVTPVGLYTWAEDGTYNAVITFAAFVPPFSASSVVDGTLSSLITLDSAVDRTVTMSFSGEITVTGAFAGAYEFEATLVFHLDTEQYSYSGTVTVDGT